MIYDFFIVGQGIAGTTLAWQLWNQGASLKIFNQNKQNTSSMSAAGLYNPVTGRKMVKSWNADLLFPYLEDFYQEVEQKTNQKFFYPKPIYRPFVSIAEQNDWLTKADNKAFAPYVEKVAIKSLFTEQLHDSWGGVLLKKSGYVDVPVYLEASRTYFNCQKMYQEGVFALENIGISPDGVIIDQQRAKCLIFCEGPEAMANPYFNWLPFQPVKGEILYIKADNSQEVVFNRGIFVLPTGESCKVGSTYDHDDLSYQTTAEARNYLEEKFQKLCKFSYKVIGQIAGVRPATIDRKPFVGFHPKHKRLAIFNGLGTKGVSVAPYYAGQFADRLINGQLLDNEVDIKRFYPLYNSVLT